jgi:hypothetical protein
MKFIIFKVKKDKRKNVKSKNRRMQNKNRVETGERLFAKRRDVLKQRKAESDARRKISFERAVFLVFILAFSVLIIAQMLLFTPSTRVFLTQNGELDGKPLGIEEYLYNKGEIVLQSIADENLKVLVNGDEIAAFKSSNVTLPVRDGDVVEIDGSALKKDVEVRIISKSDNVIVDNTEEKIKVNSDVKILTKIKVS